VTVLTIRKHQRFAVRRMARVCAQGSKWLGGLVVELSLDGCRVGNLKSEGMVIGQQIKLRIEGFGELAAQVRWAEPGLAGLRFARALHMAELDGLLRLCRGEDMCEMRAYGT
jgi:hypothetical protein